jgi:DNA modification methylase
MASTRKKKGPARSRRRSASQGKPVILRADARHLPIPDESVDLIVTSPPYWRKRDYGVRAQIGQESSPGEYILAIANVLGEMYRVLKQSGSVFLNVGDTYHRRTLAGIPARIELAALAIGWMIQNRIVWSKPNGLPSPRRDRLVSRHEFVFHLTKSSEYFYDLKGYSDLLGSHGTPSDVWQIPLRPSDHDHQAPFPPELAQRAIVLACPESTCARCGTPRQRVVRRTFRLNPERTQARRALKRAAEGGLTEAHFAAIRATGISDAGKALLWQRGTGKNSARVQQLAKEAKAVLGGYFREFTFPLWETVGFRKQCKCHAGLRPGVVLDPFCGTGTSLHSAVRMGRAAIGSDLANEYQADSAAPTNGVLPSSSDRLSKLLGHKACLNGGPTTTHRNGNSSNGRPRR